MVYDKVDPLQFVETMGKAFAMSGAGGCKTAGDGQVMALACLCEGKTVFEIARRYHLIEGKLGLKSESMLADFRAKGGKHQWIKDGIDGTEAEIRLTGPDGMVINCSMTMDRAKAAGYVKPNSNWAKRPDQMLRARCITDGIRMGWPEIACDYSVEEIEDGFEGDVGKTTSAKITKSKAEVEKRAAELKATAAGETRVEPKAEVAVSQVTTQPAKTTTPEPAIVDAEIVHTTEPEKPPFETGDADESNLPPESDNAFKFNAKVMEIESMLPSFGWDKQVILDHYNKKLGATAKDFNDFTDAQIDAIYEKFQFLANEKAAGRA
jgi:hypothetical protein